ncbi:MAG: hypothetical protein ABSC50_02600 [Candidatus Bathyarchaeia archaeon]
MAPAKKSLTQHIMEQLMKTGYPLEIEVSDIMEHDWSVFNNLPYVDEKESKTREIDIYAVHLSEPAQITERKSAFFIATSAVVECKKSDTQAWVFFTRPVKYQFLLNLGEGQTHDFLQVFSEGKKRFIDELALPNLHYANFTRVAHTYSEVKIQGTSSGKSEIFEASNQLMSYISSELHGVHGSYSGDTSRRSIHLRFPIIVFDGRLYEAIVKAGNLELKEATHMLLKTQTSAHAITGRNASYIIDIVTKESLGELLGELNADITSIRAYFNSHNEELRKKADDLVSRCVAPPKVF